MELRTTGARLDQDERLEPAADVLRTVADKAVPEGDGRRALQGEWLGHSLHPLMTDLPIGFWTSAFVLDVIGGRKGRKSADRMVGLGILTAVPTAVTGLADVTTLDPRKRSVVVHAAANSAALALYTMSYLARRRGERFRGVALGMLAATAATAGGYLGGHLAFGSSEEPLEAEREPELFDVVSLDGGSATAGTPAQPPRAGLVDGRT